MTCATPNPPLNPFSLDDVVDLWAVDLWMLPIQLSLNAMNNSLAVLLGATPRANAATDRAEGTVQDVTRAAEEQIAAIDEGKGDTMATPAALIA